MSNAQTLNPARSSGVVRVTIPAAVASDLNLFQKSITTLVDRLGCRACFSGFDCAFQHERNFVINDTLGISAAEKPALEEPQPSPWITAKLPVSVDFNIKKVQNAVTVIARQLGCLNCCSGFDILFQLEREIILGEDGNIRD